MIVGDLGPGLCREQGFCTVRHHAVSRIGLHGRFPPVLVAEGGACERSSPAGHGWPAERPQDEEAPANALLYDSSTRGSEFHKRRRRHLPRDTKPGLLVAHSPTIIHGEPYFAGGPAADG